jgi:membrane-associated phospholipid phosphatase
MYTPLPLLIVVVILLSGVIMAARLRLDTHNPLQVWVGYFTGLTVLTLFILLI